MRTFKEKECVACHMLYTPTGGLQKVCTNCHKEWWRDKKATQVRELCRRKKKLKAVEYKGNRCAHCLNIYPPAVYEFHHVNPKEKDMDFSMAVSRRWETIQNELDKCIMLCANCHRIEHHGT